jgi:hypothetical protein
MHETVDCFAALWLNCKSIRLRIILNFRACIYESRHRQYVRRRFFAVVDTTDLSKCALHIDTDTTGTSLNSVDNDRLSSDPNFHKQLPNFHYACDMADTDQTFVTTVADNMRQYTKREVTQAKTARELMARYARCRYVPL